MFDHLLNEDAQNPLVRPILNTSGAVEIRVAFIIDSLDFVVSILSVFVMKPMMKGYGTPMNRLYKEATKILDTSK